MHGERGTGGAELGAVVEDDGVLGEENVAVVVAVVAQGQRAMGFGRCLDEEEEASEGVGVGQRKTLVSAEGGDEVGTVDCDGHDDGSVGHPQFCHRYHGCHAVVQIVVCGVDGPGGGGYVAVWCGGRGGATLLAAGDEQQGQQEDEEG